MESGRKGDGGGGTALPHNAILERQGASGSGVEHNKPGDKPASILVIDPADHARQEIANMPFSEWVERMGAMVRSKLTSKEEIGSRNPSKPSAEVAEAASDKSTLPKSVVDEMGATPKTVSRTAPLVGESGVGPTNIISAPPEIGSVDQDSQANLFDSLVNSRLKESKVGTPNDFGKSGEKKVENLTSLSLNLAKGDIGADLKMGTQAKGTQPADDPGSGGGIVAARDGSFGGLEVPPTPMSTSVPTPNVNNGEATALVMGTQARGTQSADDPGSVGGTVAALDGNFGVLEVPPTPMSTSVPTPNVNNGEATALVMGTRVRGTQPASDSGSVGDIVATRDENFGVLEVPPTPMSTSVPTPNVNNGEATALVMGTRVRGTQPAGDSGSVGDIVATRDGNFGVLEVPSTPMLTSVPTPNVNNGEAAALVKGIQARGTQPAGDSGSVGDIVATRDGNFGVLEVPSTPMSTSVPTPNVNNGEAAALVKGIQARGTQPAGDSGSVGDIVATREGNFGVLEVPPTPMSTLVPTPAATNDLRNVGLTPNVNNGEAAALVMGTQAKGTQPPGDPGTGSGLATTRGQTYGGLETTTNPTSVMTSDLRNVASSSPSSPDGNSIASIAATPIKSVSTDGLNNGDILAGTKQLYGADGVNRSGTLASIGDSGTVKTASQQPDLSGSSTKVPSSPANLDQPGANPTNSLLASSLGRGSVGQDSPSTIQPAALSAVQQPGLSQLAQVGGSQGADANLSKASAPNLVGNERVGTSAVTEPKLVSNSAATTDSAAPTTRSTVGPGAIVKLDGDDGQRLASNSSSPFAGFGGASQSLNRSVTDGGVAGPLTGLSQTAAGAEAARSMAGAQMSSLANISKPTDLAGHTTGTTIAGRGLAEGMSGAIPGSKLPGEAGAIAGLGIGIAPTTKIGAEVVGKLGEGIPVVPGTLVGDKGGKPGTELIGGKTGEPDKTVEHYKT
jgi:hypothetical protein